MKTAPKQKRPIDWVQLGFDLSRRLAHYLILAGSIGCLAGLGYLAYGLFSGTMRDFSALARPDQVRLYANVLLATRVLHISVLMLTAGLLLWTPGSFNSGYWLLGGGAYLFFGVPFLVGAFLGKAVIGNSAVYALNYCVIHTGRVLITISLIVCLADALMRFRRALIEGRKRREAQAEKEALGEFTEPEEEALASRLHLLPKSCWELPVCKDYMRKACPAFEEHKTCWKRKCGCLCDQDFLINAIKGGKDFKKSDLNWLLQEGKDRSKTRNIDCRDCPIFGFHQREKFARLAPLSLPVGILIAYESIPRVHVFYQHALVVLYNAVCQISFVPGDVAQKQAATLIGSLQSNILEWLLIITVGMWSVNLFHSLIEFVTIKLKW